MRSILAVCLSLFAMILIACSGGVSSKPANRGSTEPGAKSKSSPELDAKRKDLVGKLISAGVFHKVDLDERHPVVWVTPAFKALNIDDKIKAVSVVAALAFHIAEGDKLQDGEVLYLRDSRTGKSAGTFSSSLGLDLD